MKKFPNLVKKSFKAVCSIYISAYICILLYKSIYITQTHIQTHTNKYWEKYANQKVINSGCWDYLCVVFSSLYSYHLAFAMVILCNGPPRPQTQYLKIIIFFLTHNYVSMGQPVWAELSLVGVSSNCRLGPGQLYAFHPP